MEWKAVSFLAVHESLIKPKPSPNPPHNFNIAIAKVFFNIHSAQNLTSLELKSSVVSNPVCQSELFISRFLLEKIFLSKISKI